MIRSGINSRGTYCPIENSLKLFVNQGESAPNASPQFLSLIMFQNIAVDALCIRRRLLSMQVIKDLLLFQRWVRLERFKAYVGAQRLREFPLSIRQIVGPLSEKCMFLRQEQQISVVGQYRWEKASWDE